MTRATGATTTDAGRRRALYLSSFSALAGFYLMLSGLPAELARRGTGALEASATTTVFMAATVLAEIVTPVLLRRWGCRRILLAGCLLLSTPSFVLALPLPSPALLGLCVLRGAGFAFIVIAGAALAGLFAPEGQRGEAIGVFGVIVGIPAVLGTALGVWLVGAGLFPLVAVGAGVAGALGAVAVAATDLDGAAVPDAAARPSRWGVVVASAVVFAVGATAYGALTVVVPLGAAVAGVAGAALASQAVATTAARYAAGRIGDAVGVGAVIVVSGGLLVIGGRLIVAAFPDPGATIVVLAGAVLFGLGFGGLQNATLQWMFDRVDAAAFGTASAAWNIAFDLGIGAGSLAAGLALAGG